MMPRSMRWRLPLSYAALALLTALVLGLVLLVILRGYYVQHERRYLINNARAIGVSLAPLVEAGVSPDTLQSQLDNLAFLSQTRVRLLDAGGRLLAQSNVPQQTTVAFAVVPGGYDVVRAGNNASSTRLVIGIDQKLVLVPLTATQSYIYVQTPPGISEPQLNVVFFDTMPVVGTPYGFGLNTETALDGRRSDLLVRYPFHNNAGQVQGYVELSDGPAYGWEVVESVAWGWTAASGVAILLAAGVGILISRRITGPLGSLTEITTRMAAGDLSARADVSRQDELGVLAESFNEMAQQVEGMVVTLRRFVSDAAHELHTPLTALRTDLELLAEERDRARRHTFLTRAQAQVARLEALTRGLLDLSRLEAGGVAAAYAPVDLVALAQETGELYASRAEQAGLTFTLDLPTAPVTIRGDLTQLRRAVGNLLDNALKFTSAGGTVQMGVQREGAWAVVWVADTGIGVPAMDLPHLGERFHRGSNAGDYSGSGLGLAIVKAIVEGHGGQVLAESPGVGARFALRLPASSSTI